MGVQFKILFLSLVFLLSSKVYSQSTEKTYTFVYEAKNFTSEKSLSVITNYISAIDGFKILAYCEEQGWIVFKLDEMYNTSSFDPAELFKNAPFEGEIKYNATLPQVESACKGNVVYLDKKNQ